MNKVHYQEPSMEGMGLPGVQEDAFSSMAGSVHDLVSQINRALKDSRIVYLPGQGRVPLDTALQDIVPAGTVVGYHGTLAEARRLRGWRVADGGSGTPDLLGRLLKFVAEGTQASGGTGGADVHAHQPDIGAITDANVAITVDNESAHTHTQGSTGDTSISHHHSMNFFAKDDADFACHAELCCSVNLNVSSFGHCHRVCGDTDATDCCHSHTNPATSAGSAHSHGLTNDPHTHDIAAGFSTAVASSWAPYWEGIPIIKL